MVWPPNARICYNILRLGNAQFGTVGFQTGKLAFYEVKRDARRYDRKALEDKVEAFFQKNPEKRERKIAIGTLSLADIKEKNR